MCQSAPNCLRAHASAETNFLARGALYEQVTQLGHQRRRGTQTLSRQQLRERLEKQAQVDVDPNTFSPPAAQRRERERERINVTGEGVTLVPDDEQR